MSKSISFSDLNTAVSLSAMAVLDSLCPESYQASAVRHIVSLHLALRGSKSDEIDLGSAVPELDFDARELEKEFLSGVYLEMLYTMRERWRGEWNPEIQLKGRHYLDAAMDKGRGVILWALPCTFGGLVGKKALYAEGYDVATLSSHVHPYSCTTFGIRHLNPVRTRVEDRYIVERVTLHPNAEVVAMRRIMELLGDNKIVEITAIGDADAPARIPFLGGTLNLALGAPTMAIMSRAPLVPYFPIPMGNDDFNVCIEAPLETGVGGSRRDGARCLAQQYADVMKRYVMTAPHVWRGWFSRMNWLPR